MTTGRGRASVVLGCVLAMAAAAAGCGAEDDAQPAASATAAASETTASAGETTTGVESAEATTELSTEPVELVMWWWGDQEAKGLEAYVAESVEAYKKERPNVTIETVLQSTDNLVPSFQAAAQAKEGPDIQYFWGGIYTMEPFWAGGITPIEDLLGEEETKHYINREESSFDGKAVTAGWYVQPSFPLLTRTDVLEQGGVTSTPKTWDELMAACRTLREQGITPIAGGIKDGWFGGWLYSILGSQAATADQVKSAVVGDEEFTDEQHAVWWTRLQEMVTNKCWNDDIGSVDLYQGQQLWSDGKAAMTIAAGTDVRKFLTEVGADKVEVGAMPPYGDGPGAGKLGSTSQTLGVTSFSEHQPEAADFIRFLHTPERLQAFYEATGAFPADDRFDSAAITEPQLKSLYELAADGAPYLENFMPAELDAKANFAFSQLLLGGKLEPQTAAEDTEAAMARIRTTQPDLLANFKKWSGQ